MRSPWGAIANPQAKVFDPASTPQSTPGAWPQQQNENSVQYVFYILFVRTHTNFGIKTLELIFDLLTSPQSHQFEPGIKILLAFCSALHRSRFDMPYDHVWKKKLWHLGTPSTPKSHPWGMTQATEWKSHLICFVCFIYENIHKVWNKNLWNWLWNWF